MTQSTANPSWRARAFVAVLTAGLVSIPFGAASVREDEQAIQGLLSRLGEWSVAGDGENFAGSFSLPAVMTRIRRSGPVAGLTGAPQEQAFLDGIRHSLVQQVVAFKGTGSLWTSVRASRVSRRGNEGEVEADALIHIALPGGVSPSRFWLVREEAGWKICDYEILDQGFRLSLQARTSYEASRGLFGKLALTQAFRREQTALAKLTSGDLKGALEDAAALRRTAPTPSARTTGETVEMIALYRLGRNEEVVAAADRIVSADPNAAFPHLQRAQALHALGRWKECIRESERYLELVGNDPRAYLAIGLSQERLGRTEDALRTFSRGAIEDPEDAENPYHQGRILLAHGDRKGALRAFLRMLENWPHDDSHYDLAAEALSEAGCGEELKRLTQAERRLESAREGGLRHAPR